MNVKGTQIQDQRKIRQSFGVAPRRITGNKKRMPKKQKVARLKIISGRGYYYEIENVWDRKEQRCRQKSKYLGRTLPRGYRLVR